MSKSSLFTLFLSATLVVMIAELLTDQYLKTPFQLKGDIFAAENGTEERVSLAPAVKKPENSQPPVLIEGVTPGLDTLPLDTQASDTQPGTNQDTQPLINFAVVQEAGFSAVTLQRVPFNGSIFDKIDISDRISMPVLQQNLLKNNVARDATFYEFSLKSHTLAQEIYALLKQKGSNQIGASVNETNGFGEKSFYVNFLDYPERAFLVVKKGGNVYSLSYVKIYHPFIQKLIQLLP